ncbi:MAG: hypothetical protein HKK66_05325 [Chlorobiaceae bacterium]|nr:hypothetical protein [Chlorobiaceae bacterium]
MLEVFTHWGEEYGRLVEVFVDGTWWTMVDYLRPTKEIEERFKD